MKTMTISMVIGAFATVWFPSGYLSVASADRSAEATDMTTIHHNNYHKNDRNDQHEQSNSEKHT